MDPASAVRLRIRAGHPDFLDLPWQEPLGAWDHSRLVPMAHGISRHVVRFVRYDERVYALKATTPQLASYEYQTLRDLHEEQLPVVEVVGVVHAGDHSTLITRYLDYSLPYWYLIGRDEGPNLTTRLIDAAAVLIVRLHLSGVFWGDCSPSNVLFRRDAGALMAYLVDAETAELRPSIADRLRQRDLDIAWENLCGSLMDLQAAGRVPDALDPVEVADTLRFRYDELWGELTRTDEFDESERWRIEARVRHLQDMGFDVEELSIEQIGGEHRLRIRPVLVEEGHHARELQRRTGLTVQENQARRLLSDIEAFRAHRARTAGHDIAPGVGAALWMAEVFEPIVSSVPAELRSRLDDAELFHELLEHRYFLSEQAHREVTNPEALADYVERVLPGRPVERNLGATPDDP